MFRGGENNSGEATSVYDINQQRNYVVSPSQSELNTVAKRKFDMNSASRERKCIWIKSIRTPKHFVRRKLHFKQQNISEIDKTNRRTTKKNRVITGSNN